MKECRFIYLVVSSHDHDRDVVFACCGVLINLASDESMRCTLCQQELGTIHKLVSVVRSASLQDIEMSTIASKVLMF